MPWSVLSYLISPGSLPRATAETILRRRLRLSSRLLTASALAVAAVVTAAIYLTNPEEGMLRSAPFVLASLVPASALTLYLVDEADGARVAAAVASGGALVVAAYFIGVEATSFTASLGAGYPASIAAAVAAEEALKTAAVLAFVYLAGTRKPVEAAGVGALVGLGFAGVENLVYVVNSGEVLLMSLERSAVAPVHVLTSATAGGVLACLRSRGWLVAAGAGFAVAAALHATYNLGVLGEIHPVLGDGAGYVVFALAFYFVAIAAAEVARTRSPMERARKKV